MSVRKTVNSWVFDRTAPGLHLPKLSLGPTFINPTILQQCSTSKVIRVPSDGIESIELAVKYWIAAAGSIHTISIEEGCHKIEGEYLRIGYKYPLTIQGVGSNLTKLNGGIRCMNATTNLKLIDLSISNRRAASPQISRHGLFVNDGAKCEAIRCAFVDCGGSGVCCNNTKVSLIDCVCNRNSRAGLYAVNGGNITLHGSTTFQAIDNGKDSTNCQLEASGKDSTIIGLLRLEKMSVIGNTVIQWDRCLGRNKSWVAPHTREKYGGIVT